MIGWWEASWANVIVTCVVGLGVLVVIWAGLEELYHRQAPPRCPPRVQPPLIPRGGGSALPANYPRQRPLPQHNHGPLERTADIWECGCVSVWRRSTGRWQIDTCWRHEFDTEWEARLSR